MRFIMEYMGLTLLSVVVGAAVLYVFVNAPDSGLTQAGNLAEQQAEGFSSVGTGLTYGKEEMDQRITFFYEEKTYFAGMYEKLVDQFTAVDAKGKQIPVQVEQVVSIQGDVCESDQNGATFIGEGIYEVFVTARGACYKVTVPVVSAE